MVYANIRTGAEKRQAASLLKTLKNRHAQMTTLKPLEKPDAGKIKEGNKDFDQIYEIQHLLVDIASANKVTKSILYVDGVKITPPSDDDYDHLRVYKNDLNHLASEMADHTKSGKEGRKFNDDGMPTQDTVNDACHTLFHPTYTAQEQLYIHRALKTYIDMQDSASATVVARAAESAMEDARAQRDKVDRALWGRKFDSDKRKAPVSTNTQQLTDDDDGIGHLQPRTNMKKRRLDEKTGELTFGGLRFDAPKTTFAANKPTMSMETTPKQYYENTIYDTFSKHIPTFGRGLEYGPTVPHFFRQPSNNKKFNKNCEANNSFSATRATYDEHHTETSPFETE